MARNYFAPGVYVEEVPSAQQPIAGVGTNTAAFIGILPNVFEYPVENEKYDPVAAGKKAEVPDQSKLDKLNSEKTKLEEEINTIKNKIKDAKDAEKRQLEQGKRALQTELASKEEEIKNFENPANVAPESLRPYRLKKFETKVDPCAAKLCTNFSEYTKRFGPFPAYYNNNGKAITDPVNKAHRALAHAVYGFFRNGGTKCFVVRIDSDNGAKIDKALSAIDSIDAVALVACPGLGGVDTWGRVIDHCIKTEDRFAIFDSPVDVGSENELDIKLLNYDSTDNVLPHKTKHGAVYFPHIQVVDSAKQFQEQDPSLGIDPKHRGRTYVPPSGHVAGIYSSTDERRGVHKAPANVAVSGALNVKYYISKRKQELLNPQGVNCIRNMNGNISVWGARTIGGDQNGEWKYVNVRRVFLFIRESIDEGTQWVVFEPNDRALWSKIRRNVSAFLTNVWRSGALFGSTPEEAFYVKCDDETNPPELRDIGQVVTEIGIAIVRPAEFVIFRIAQKADEGST